MPSVFSSSNLAAMEDTYISLRMLVWYRLALIRSRDVTASCVNFRSPSSILLILSTIPLDFLSLSRASLASSSDCSSFPFTLARWLYLSSAIWISSLSWRQFCLSLVDLSSYSIAQLFSVFNVVHLALKLLRLNRCLVCRTVDVLLVPLRLRCV